jgi:hypothetical protein
LSAVLAGKKAFMLEQIIIYTSDAKRLRPIIESALRHMLEDVEHGIQLTRERLETFETQFGMNTTEFERRFTPNDLGETLDFIEWDGEIKMLRLLEEKRDLLKEAKIA